MTLSDELEALAKEATPGPWKHEIEGISTSRIRGADDPNFRRMAAVNAGPRPNAELIVALFNNLPIIAALRQPDAVPSDLVARLRSGNIDEQAVLADEAAAAIQSLTAERDALAKAVLATVDATRSYLPPDGVDAQECLNRILGATDNLEINPIIALLEGQSHD